MQTESTPDKTSAPPPQPSNEAGWRRLWRLLIGSLGGYLLVAYVVLPLFWRADFKHHPALAGGPGITHTANGIPGDPVDLAIIGSEAELVHAMTDAKWYPTDPITLRTSKTGAAYRLKGNPPTAHE